MLEVYNPLPVLSAADDVAGLSGLPTGCREAGESPMAECVNSSVEDSLGSNTSQPHLKPEALAAWLDDANAPTPRVSSEVELTSPSCGAGAAVTETACPETLAGRGSPLAVAAGRQSQAQLEEEERVAGASSIEQLAALLQSAGVEPLSSTPASDSRSPLLAGLARGAATAGALEGEGLAFVEAGGLLDEFDRGSVTSLSSLPEGTFLGEARHKDGSLLSIIFQVMCWHLVGLA